MSKALNTFREISRKVIGKRDSFLEQKIEIFKDEYWKRYLREPREREVEKYRKDIVMLYGLLIYLPLIAIIFIIIQLVKGVFNV